MASPDDREGPRRLVKATYAHKKGRISKTSGLLNINASSPLQILDGVHAATLVPISEMTRRMLKRSRQSQIPVPQNQQQQHEQPKRKRSKTGNSTDAAQSYSMVLNDVRPKSRNLKENSSPAYGKSISSSRTLGKSPSNHHSSPRGNSRKSTKGRSSRLALATKSIPVSSITNSQHENTKNHSTSGTSLLNQESTANLSKGTRIQPLRPHSQRKSISFLVRMSKKISLADLPRHIVSKPSTPVLTLANFSPTVVSTPLPNLNVSFVAKHFGVPELSENSNAIPAISPAHKRQDSNLDIPKFRKIIHIPSNSIFSDSVDFTLVSSRTYDPSPSNNEAQLVTDSDSLFEPRTPKKKQSISLKEVVFGPDGSSSIIAAPSCPQTQTQKSITDNGDTGTFLFPPSITFCLRVRLAQYDFAGCRLVIHGLKSTRLASLSRGFFISSFYSSCVAGVSLGS